MTSDAGLLRGAVETASRASGPVPEGSDPTATVTVVVVTYESASVIEGCLRSLPGAFAGAARPSVVVVDNASTDATTALVAATAPDARVVPMGSNRGYAAAINAGLDSVGSDVGDAVLVLNPDVRLAPGAMEPMLSALRLPGTGVVVPRLVGEDGTTHPSLRRDPTILRTLGEAFLGGPRAGRFPRLGESVTCPGAYDVPQVVDWATGAVMLIGRECIDRVGPWDEQWFLYSEEVDYALRVRDAGMVVRYVPTAEAIHIGGASDTDPRLWSLVVRNKVGFYRSRHGPIRSAAFAGAVAVNEGIRAASGRPANRAALRSLLSRGRSTPAGTSSPRAPSTDGLVCFSAQDWWYFNRAHSDFQLLVNAARTGRRVLLVNSLGMRLPTPGTSTTPLLRIGRKLKSMTKGLRHPLPDVPGFAVFTPLFLPAYGPGPLRDLSNRLVRWQVRWAMRREALSRPAVVVTLPTAWEVARDLPRRRLLAYRSDRYSAFDEADGSWVAGLERELLDHADVAMYASPVLLDREAHMSRRPVVLDHGVDLDLFRLAEEVEPSPRLRDIPRPRVGFFGAVDDYTVDLDLLERLAVEVPEAQLVLVGPSNCDLDGITSHDNVHWLGPCPPEEVPSYGAGFDVALMPWLDNEWIAHSNPIKLKEYLALGLPVVTTALPTAERYRDVLRIAASGDEFVEMVRRTLRDGGPGTSATRRAAVAGDSWARRAEELLELADEPAAGP